jgi:amino acid transporter
MDIKKIEKISTSAGVVMLGALAIFGILGCLELVFDINFFVTARAADIWTVIPLITCVLIFCCFLVSTMLNISRVAESMESLADMSNKNGTKEVSDTN